MQDFKKIIYRIGKLILFFILLLSILLVLSRKVMSDVKKNDSMISDRNKSLINIQKENKNSIDVLILGDSESYYSVSPMQIWGEQGITSYVCGQAGQKVQETYYMLKKALETQSPEVVVLETNTLFREQKRMESMEQTIAEQSYYYLPILRFHDVWKSYFLGKKYPKEYYKGFEFHTDVKAYEGGDYMEVTEEKTVLSEVSLNYLEKIRKLCEENQAKLMLLSAPSPMNYNTRMHNELISYSKKNAVDYVNLNLMTKDLGIDWTKDTMDMGDHLNLSGAQKVTTYIGNYLKEKYGLTDHRKEAAYENWNQELIRYNEAVTEKKEILDQNVNNNEN